MTVAFFLPEFAINQARVKIHVSNGYHKRFYKDGLLNSDTDFPTPKIHLKIKVSVGSNNFPEIIFRIILTWQLVFMISQVFNGIAFYRISQ